LFIKGGSGWEKRRCTVACQAGLKKQKEEQTRARHKKKNGRFSHGDDGPGAKKFLYYGTKVTPYIPIPGARKRKQMLAACTKSQQGDVTR